MEIGPYKYEYAKQQTKQEKIILEGLSLKEFPSMERSLSRNYKAGYIYSSVKTDSDGIGTTVYLLCLSNMILNRILVCGLIFRPIYRLNVKPGDIEIGMINDINRSEVAFTRIDLIQNMSLDSFESLISASSIQSIILDKFQLLKTQKQIGREFFNMNKDD
ncbi:MAG: hypothetical protein RRZ92_00575 [Bacilli bacterium]